MDDFKIDKKKSVIYNDNYELEASDCFERGMAFVKDGDYKEAFKWYNYGAQLDEPSCVTNVGIFYLMGLGVEKNEREAARYLKRAYGMGNAMAGYNLGILYENGIVFNKDVDKAFDIFDKASSLGSKEATRHLGIMYYTGSGVGRNPRMAVEYFRRAANMGDFDAQYNLGVCLINGEGIEPKAKDGVGWITAAAMNGSAKAQFRMGEICETGKFVQQDIKKARDWYQLAANQNFPDAINALNRLDGKNEKKLENFFKEEGREVQILPDDYNDEKRPAHNYTPVNFEV